MYISIRFHKFRLSFVLKENVFAAILTSVPADSRPFLKFIYLFGVLRHFQHCTGHITTGSWKGRGNQYIQFIRLLYCKLPTNGKQLPAFPLEAVPGTEPRPQRWEGRVLPLCHHGPVDLFLNVVKYLLYPLSCVKMYRQKG